MSEKPTALVKIDDLAANLRTTMARAGDVFSPSMRKQLPQMVSAYLRRRLSGEAFIHPGMEKMGRWGGCCERQARRNFTQLRGWGVVVRVAFPKGGRRATRFTIDFTALKILLIEMGANPSPVLCDKLAEAAETAKNPDTNPDINPDIKAAKNPDICPDTMSAGIHRDREALARGDSRPRLRSISGGRDA